MSQTQNNFNGYSTDVFKNDGTLDLYVNSAKVKNLSPALFVQTDNTSTLESTNGKGDKGDTGNTGPQGPTGPQGIQGIQGNGVSQSFRFAICQYVWGNGGSADCEVACLITGRFVFMTFQGLTVQTVSNITLTLPWLDILPLCPPGDLYLPSHSGGIIQLSTESPVIFYGSIAPVYGYTISYIKKTA